MKSRVFVYYAEFCIMCKKAIDKVLDSPYTVIVANTATPNAPQLDN